MKFLVASLVGAALAADYGRGYSNLYGQGGYGKAKPAPTYEAPPAVLSTLEDVVAEVTSLSGRVASLQKISAAPSVGDGCASACQSALVAKSPDNCPAYCSGISVQPVFSLAVTPDPTNGNSEATSMGAMSVCSPSRPVFGNTIDLSAANTNNFGLHLNSANGVGLILGWRVPIPKLAEKVRAVIRLPFEAAAPGQVAQDSDVMKFRLAAVEDKALANLFKNGHDGASGTPGPSQCGEDGGILDMLMQKGLMGDDDSLVTNQCTSGIYEVDISKELGKMVRSSKWAFNNVLFALLTLQESDYTDGNDDPANVPVPVTPAVMAEMGELALKFARPKHAAHQKGGSYGYGSGSYGGYGDQNSYGSYNDYGANGGYGAGTGYGYTDSYGYGNGYGSGYGYGDSYSSGYGDSYGYGAGYGDSYGYGGGYGSGYGDSYGYDSGYGSGYGDSYGSGYGSGYGDSYGSNDYGYY